MIYADTAAFAALLEFTGPMSVPGTDLVLTQNNAEAFLLADQFSAFPTLNEADEAVSSLIDDVVTEFGTTRLPRPSGLAAALGPVVERGSLQFVTFDDRDDDLLDAGRTGAVRCTARVRDLLALVRNANPSKVDVFLERSVYDDVEWDPETGSVGAVLHVELTNTAPASGLPSGGGEPDPGPERRDQPHLGVRAEPVAGSQRHHRRRASGVRRTAGAAWRPAQHRAHGPRAGRDPTTRARARGEVGAGRPTCFAGSAALGQPGSVEVEVRTDGAPFADGADRRAVELDARSDALLTFRTR